MKKIPAFLLLLLLTTAAFAQQEEVSPLGFNHAQYNTNKQNLLHKHKYQVGGISTSSAPFIISTDTLQLPFVDDFSRNTLTQPKWVETHITDTFYNVFGTCLGAEGVPTITEIFMTDTARYYYFDTTTQTVLDTAIPSIKFTFFGPSPSACFAQAPQTFIYWPQYYTYKFDSATGKRIDSTLVTTGTEVVSYAPIVYFAQGQPGTLWFDSYAYINNTYPIAPPTIGVATLDGLNEYGLPYNNQTQFTYGDADRLTSNPINLSGLPNDDSTLYISFFYEGGGRGESPDLKDSLLLQVKDNQGEWRTIWVRGGYSSGNAPLEFKQVLVQVPTLIFPFTYFHNTFQFRFRNMASLYGNLDHWHIDYVKVDTARNINDSLIQDIAFVYPFPTLLKEFTLLPADQLLVPDDLVDTINVLVHNLDAFANINRPATNFVKGATETYPTQAIVMTDVLQTFNAGADNFIDMDPFSQYSIPATPNWPVDSLVIVSKVIIDPNDSRPQNDTILQEQVFSNVMAYDDGSAETAYGITGTQPKAFGYEFNLRYPDTLVAIQVMYAQVEQNVNDLVFNFCIWDSLRIDSFDLLDESVPVLSLDNRKPYYVDSVNGFTTYKLETPLDVSGKIYAGWKQNDSETRSLQIGLDMNSKLGRKHMFAYTNGKWHASTLNLQGSPMIRLIFDSDYKGGGTAINDITLREEHLDVFPNPTTGYLSLRSEQPMELEVSVYNAIGQTMLHQNETAGQINISALPNGVYLLIARNTVSGKVYRNKIIKTGN